MSGLSRRRALKTGDEPRKFLDQSNISMTDPWRIAGGPAAKQSTAGGARKQCLNPSVEYLGSPHKTPGLGLWWSRSSLAL